MNRRRRACQGFPVAIIHTEGLQSRKEASRRRDNGRGNGGRLALGDRFPNLRLGAENFVVVYTCGLSVPFALETP